MGLKNHFEKVHIGKAAEECPICGKLSKDVKHHIAYAHDNKEYQWKKYKCKFCDYREKRLSVVQRHMGTKHIDMGLIRCSPTCEFTGFSHRQLERHMWYIHQKVEPLPDKMPYAEKRFIKSGIPIHP